MLCNEPLHYLIFPCTIQDCLAGYLANANTFSIAAFVGGGDSSLTLQDLDAYTTEAEQKHDMFVGKIDNKDTILITDGVEYEGYSAAAIYGAYEQNRKEKTNYLPFLEDRATFMFLDANRGTWFVTSELSGCDVWVAHCGTAVFVLHINANSLGDYPLDNLGFKQNVAKVALTLINADRQPACKFVQRFSYDYSKDSGVKTADMKKYWSGFAKHHKHVAVKKYDGNSFFYGKYDSQASSWKFALRRTDTQTIVHNEL